MSYTKVVIIGGGFGGLNVAQALKKADAEVLLIDRTNHHLFQPLLYQVATAALSSGTIATPIREILRNQKNTSVIMGEVVSIDKRKQEVVFANGETTHFDYLVVATGASHSYFGHDEWEKFAPGLKTLQDATRIREHILYAYEQAERCDSISEAKKFMQFVVIGGGPTGVEMAGAIAEISHQALFKNFRKIKPEQSKIYLIEGLSQVLPSYPPDLGAIAKKDLEKLGVKVLLNTKVTNITQNGVYIGEKFIETPNVIWAAGNTASPLLKTLATPLDRQNRLVVQPDLTVPGSPNIFVIGDAAACIENEGQTLPGIAPVAIQQGRYVAKIIKQRIAPEKRKPFKYFDKGSMATIGKSKAVAMVGKLKFSGFTAWVAWCFIHILYLISFRNRMIVLMQWMFWYFTGKRNVRLIMEPVDELSSSLPKKG